MSREDLKFKKMQDEMSRFEAEIGERRPAASHRSYAPTVSAPPSLLLPTQVQRKLPPPLSAFPAFGSNPPAPDPEPPRAASPPARPQPAVLSSAPQLYKKPPKDRKDHLAADISKSVHVAEVDRSFMPVVPVLATPAVPTPKTHHHSSSNSSGSGHKKEKKEKKNRKTIRTAGGSTWEDPSLLEWPEDDFRLFCGDLGNDVTDELLSRTFSKYSSFSKAKVIRDKRTNKSKGFGFISFREPADFIKAMKEMNGRYVGSRPIKLRKSTWKARSLDTVRKKEKEKAALISLLTSGPSKS